jgi:hypothetical protein
VRKVKLTVSNGACPSEIEVNIELPAPGERQKVVVCVAKGKIDLEPNNNEEVTELDTDATITDKKKVTVDLKKTLASGKAENYVNYTLPSGMKKEVLLIVQSNNAGFFMKITEEVGANNRWKDSRLILEAKNVNANNYDWVVTQGANRVTSSLRDFDLSFKASGFSRGDIPILVALKIKNEGQECDALAQFIIVDAIYRERKNKDRFDNNNQP